MRASLLAAALALAAPLQVSAQEPAGAEARQAGLAEIVDMVGIVVDAERQADPDRYTRLTDDDYRQVAEELGIEVAVIKAVVRIEAGAKLEGFWAPGVPVANYSASLYNRYAKKHKGRKIADEKVPDGLKGYALKEWTALVNARKKNADAADMGTYWGMFQIGGAHYKLCGCESVEEMVEKMSESEHSQLKLFATFIKNAGMLESLRKKDWASFARKYNGPSYARRGYHTRMAKEYAKFRDAEAKAKE